MWVVLRAWYNGKFLLQYLLVLFNDTINFWIYRSVIDEWIWNKGRMILHTEIKNVEKNLSHCNSCPLQNRHGLAWNLTWATTVKSLVTIVGCFWKLLSNIIIRFESYSYLGKAHISIINLYEIKVAHTYSYVLPIILEIRNKSKFLLVKVTN